MIRTLRDVRWVVGKHLWPLRVNRFRYLGRRLTHRWRLVARAESPITGVITVWDLGRERRVMFGDDPGAITQSAIFTRGGWAELRREYWGQMLQPPVQLPARPRVLVLGLGGGTIVRMVYQLTRPSIVTVVELDPVVAQIAREHMGLGSLPDLEIRIGDARDALTELTDGEPYDVVIEDVFYRGLPESDATQLNAYVESLAAVVTQDGWLVLNRWFGDWSGAVGPPPADGMLTTVAWTLADGTTHYALEGSIFVTGSAIQWLRDGLELFDDAAEAGPIAASVDDSGGMFVVPAFTGLGSPWWDPYARGTIVGITRGVGRAHLVRAVVESMAFQTRDVVEAMVAASGTVITDLRVDGGASAMDLLCQIQADQLGVIVRRPVDRETTALGAAFLAGLAEGVWPTIDAIAARWEEDAEFTPAADRTLPDLQHAEWLRAVERSRAWTS